MKTVQLKIFFHDAAIVAGVCAAALIVYQATPRPQRATQSWGSYTYANTDSGFSLYADRPNTYFLFTENTITYGKNDVVYDNSGTLYTENTDTIRKIVEEKTNTTLFPSDSTIRSVSLQASMITLINPDVPGAIRAHLPDNTPIVINKDTRTISLSKPIRIEVIPTL